MDFDKLLKTVVKAKTSFIRDKDKRQRKTMKVQNREKLDETIPLSLTQLLTKYSPKCSPSIKKYENCLKKTGLVSRLNLILLKNLKNFWKRWTGWVPKKNKFIAVKKVSVVSSPPCKQRLVKTKSLLFNKNSVLDNYDKAAVNRQKTIQKLESVVCIVRKVRKLEIRGMEIAFQCVRKRGLGKVFEYFLGLSIKSYLSSYMNQILIYSKSVPLLSITKPINICITPLPKSNSTWLVTTETSFTLPAFRYTYSPFTMNITSQSRDINSHNLSQSFDLPNLSSLESIKASSFNSKSPLHSQNSSQESFHFFQGPEDLVEFEVRSDNEEPTINYAENEEIDLKLLKNEEPVISSAENEEIDSKLPKNQEIDLKLPQIQEDELIFHKNHSINDRYKDLEIRDSLPQMSIESCEFIRTDWKALTCIPKLYHQFFEDPKKTKETSKDLEEKGQISTCVSIQSNLSQKLKQVKIGKFKNENHLKEAVLEALKENVVRNKKYYKGIELVNRMFYEKIRKILILF